MYLKQAQGRGVRAVMQCYEARLLQVEHANAFLNGALLRVTKHEMNNALSTWDAFDKPAILRARMPDSLVDELRRVLAVVSIMRFVDKKTLTWALLFACSQAAPAIVNMFLKLYGRAGAIDKLIDVYEQSIDVFNVDVDVRNVGALLHGVVAQHGSEPVAAEKQQMCALKLAEQSGLVDHQDIHWQAL
jgi:hypothetical protein